jgi:hypothetical protein
VRPIGAIWRTGVRASRRRACGRHVRDNARRVPSRQLREVRRPRCRAGAARALAAEGEGGRDALPAGARNALAELLPELGGTGTRADDEPSARQGRLFEAILALLERLGRSGPVLLAIEDLHWAAGSTRDFITFLVRSAREEPLCLVVTYRSDELHRRHPLRAELERSATRCSPRSCWRPIPSRLRRRAQLTATAGCCPRRCATCCSRASSGSRPSRTQSCAPRRCSTGRSRTGCSRRSRGSPPPRRWRARARPSPTTCS